MGSQFKALRQRMVDCQIRPVDVTDLAILKAFLTVEREDYLPKAWLDVAYSEKEIPLLNNPISSERFLLRPAVLAKLLQLLSAKQSDHVLIVGAATGYSSAILSQYVDSVVALEEDETLLEWCKDNLEKNDINNVSLIAGDLLEGCKVLAPYDAILIEGRLEFVPVDILQQLKEGGRLVLIEGGYDLAHAKVYIKQETAFSEQIRFMVPAPLLIEKKNINEFQF